MNIVFGQLVGTFNEYFIPGPGITEGSFKSSVNQNR
jgi:ATP-binding cassette subfamily B (MDR/TAP) protein 1